MSGNATTQELGVFFCGFEITCLGSLTDLRQVCEEIVRTCSVPNAEHQDCQPHFLHPRLRPIKSEPVSSHPIHKKNKATGPITPNKPQGSRCQNDIRVVSTRPKKTGVSARVRSAARKKNHDACLVTSQSSRNLLNKAKGPMSSLVKVNANSLELFLATYEPSRTDTKATRLCVSGRVPGPTCLGQVLINAAVIVQVNYGRRAHTATAPPKSRQPELSVQENRVSRLPIKRVLQKVRQNTNPDEVTFSIRRWAVESPIGLHGYVHPDL